MRKMTTSPNKAMLRVAINVSLFRNDDILLMMGSGDSNCSPL